MAEFVTALHEQSFTRMQAFLRDEVKARALLTNLNGWTEVPPFMAARTRLDWVDNHFYWDHPQFLEGDWRLPSQGGSGGGSALAAGGAGPGGPALTRLWGKPFSISEFNYSAPNPYRAEGGILMGAAAALQDWDAVWRFAYSHNRDSVAAPRPLNYFDMASDPAGMASERSAVLLFRRADLAPLPGTMVPSSSREELLRGTARRAEKGGVWSTMLGLRVPDDGKASETALSRPAGRADAVTIDPARATLRVDTPCLAAVISPAGSTVAAGPLSARIEGARAAVYAASLDGSPLSKSRRILLVHMTDVQNTGMRYGSPDRRVLLDWGGLPHLARIGKATVTLAREAPAGLTAWRLDTAGNRLGKVPVRIEGGKAGLDLAIRGEDGKATLYYEVTTAR